MKPIERIDYALAVARGERPAPEPQRIERDWYRRVQLRSQEHSQEREWSGSSWSGERWAGRDFGGGRSR